MSNDIIQTIIRVKETIIRFPQFDLAYTKIIQSMDIYEQTGIARHMVCFGSSGTGKSTLKKAIERSHPSYAGDSNLIIPVFVIDTPALPTVKNMAEAILLKIGDNCFDRGTAINKTNRVLHFLEKCQVKLIIVDELQHFIDQGKKNTPLQVSDWLKNLIDTANIPTILMGLERSDHILRINEQLRRRFNHHLELSPFNINEGIGTFIGVISTLDQLINLPNKIELNNNDLLTRIYFATNGIIDYMVKLILGAYEIAVNQGLLEINMCCLEEAFTEVIWINGRERLNPFNRKFAWEQLDKIGMPFHKNIAVSSISGWN